MVRGNWHIIPRLLLVLAIVCISACSTTKSVPEGDRLFTGSNIKWDGKKPRDYGTLTAEMQSSTRPKPNKKFAGLPFRLWFYNLGKEPKGKGLNYLLRRKWGEAPVLLSQAKPDYTANVLEQYLVDNGFFQAAVTSDIKTRGKKKASILYTATPNHRYRIKSVTYITDSSILGKAITAAGKGKSSLKLNRPYRLDSIKAERNRIHNILKEQGYYYFTPDYLLVEVDSTNNGMVDLYVTIKPETPAPARKKYHMKNITVYPNYSLDNDSLSRAGTPLIYNRLRIIDTTKKFRPSVFDRSIFLRPDSLYRLSSHNVTLHRLTDLGTFKFVKGTFRPVRGDSSLLNASFFLTPYPRRSLQAELRGTSKSNNFVGSEVKITARNRNWLHAANLLELSVSGGLEWQVGGKATTVQTGGNSYNFKTEAAVTIPRFWQPIFKGLNVRTPYVPRTRISVSYELYSRSQLYNLNAYSFNFQYIWRKTEFLEHKWSPFSVTYVLPTKTTAGYDSILKYDPSQRSAIEKQFILGGNYNVTFNNQSANRIHSFYINGDVDYSGNIAGLIVPKGDSSKNILGIPFAQFVRLTVDARHYWKLNRKLTWVNRIYAGYGLPYGNSSTLPFVKQYFIGGSSSLRGFRARTLGPGSYKDTSSKYLANEAGDIKLEYNSELRARLTGIFNAAVFVDAGNIWLKGLIPDKPGSQFKFGSFGSQIAVDAGAGLRIDASIIVVRLDLAFPLRKPWLPQNERWVIKDVKFGDPDWRKENLILNIAIGYPF